MVGKLPVGLSKAELVHKHLTEAILTGTLRPGQRISMDEMARELGVSKIPIREAIARLQSEGMIETAQHVGPVVSAIEEDQLTGIFIAREALEPIAARLAAERMDDATLNALNSIQDRLGNELASASPHKWSNLSGFNSDFHGTIARLTGYDTFVDFTAILLSSIRRYRLTASSPGNWESTVVEHAAIIDAFEHGSPDDAAAAALAHVRSQMAKEAPRTR